MNVILPYLQCELTQEEFLQGIGSEFPEKYIVCTDGRIFKRIELGEGRFFQYQVERLPTKENKKLPEMKEEIHFLPAGKVPISMYHQIVDFFKKVMGDFGGDKLKNHGALEAMAHIVWNPKQDDTKYQIRIPTQKVSAANVSYEFDHLEDGDVIIVDIHSHNNMGAFFSGTDDSDDKKNTCYSGVVGKLNTPNPENKWRFNDLDKKKFDAKFDEIFEAEVVECPKEWLEKVTRGYGGMYGGVYGGNQGWWSQRGGVGTGRSGHGGQNFGQGGRGGSPGNQNAGRGASRVVGLDGLPLLDDGEDDSWMEAYGIPASRDHDFDALDLELNEMFGNEYPVASLDPTLTDPVVSALKAGTIKLEDFAVVIPRFIKADGSSDLWVDKYSEDEGGNFDTITEDAMLEIVHDMGEFMMYIKHTDTYIISDELTEESTPEELLEIYASTIEVEEEDLFPVQDGSLSPDTVSNLMKYLENGTTYMDQILIVAYLQRISASGKLDELLEEAGLKEKGESNNASIH